MFAVKRLSSGDQRGALGREYESAAFNLRAAAQRIDRETAHAVGLFTLLESPPGVRLDRGLRLGFKLLDFIDRQRSLVNPGVRNGAAKRLAGSRTPMPPTEDDDVVREAQQINVFGLIRRISAPLRKIET